MAQDNDKRPMEPFNLAADENEISIVFESDMDDGLQDDDESLRGNTDPKHDPKNVKNKGYTPMGSGPSLGASSSRSQGQTPSQPAATEKQPSDDEWQHALRNGNHTFEEEFNGLRVRTWMADQPSDQNIQGGHIKEMIVTEGEYGSENRLALFQDGAWKHPPEATPERHAALLAAREYDGEFLKEKLERETQGHEQQLNFVPVPGHRGKVPLSRKGAWNGTIETNVHR